MNRNVFLTLIFIVVLWTVSAFAGTPVFTFGLTGGSVREMDTFRMSVQATDTHPLVYAWSIELDETGGQASLTNAYQGSAELGIRWISAAAAGQLNGRRVTLKVVARHANPLVDGPEEAETTGTITVSGVNHPPTATITGNVGTPTNRIPTGGSVCLSADISDPDGDSPRSNWDWGVRSGGRWRTAVGDLAPSLFGSEGGNCCFRVIDMTAPIDQQMVLTMLDGLHASKAYTTCYLKPADATGNQTPVAKIQYRIGTAPYTNAPTTPVTIDTGSAVALMISGDTSTDDGGASNLIYTWAKTDSINDGDVTIGSSTGPNTTLQIAAHTQGSSTIRLTAKDQGNLTGSASISFNFGDSGQKPVARVTARVGSQPLTAAVDAGTVVTLDGRASSRADGTQNSLMFQWTQTEGPKVSLTNPNSSIAQFTAPAGSDVPTWLKFRLVVGDGIISSEPAEVAVDLNTLTSYFSQVAVGALGTSEFRTCLLLLNGTSEPANGVEVKFFGQDGNPMGVSINGTLWDSQPFSIPPFSSERLVFTGDELKVGWARVKADIRLSGLLLYQVVGENQELHTQIGMYSTEAARKFATFYDPSIETGIAVANPSGQPAAVRVRIVDNKTGAEVLNKPLFSEEPGSLLPSLDQRARFLTAGFLGHLPAGFSVGTLLVESDVPISVTILQTRGGVVFSTLPVRTLR